MAALNVMAALTGTAWHVVEDLQMADLESATGTSTLLKRLDTVLKHDAITELHPFAQLTIEGSSGGKNRFVNKSYHEVHVARPAQLHLDAPQEVNESNCCLRVIPSLDILSDIHCNPLCGILSDIPSGILTDI
jgi:hypothetical protein